MTSHVNPDAIILERGSHAGREDGLCLLEAAAWWAGQPHTDSPPCVSPVLGAYGRVLNDALGRDKRQELRPFIRLLPGTAGDGLDEARGYMALDWLIRTSAPVWLDLAGLAAEAAALRDLRRIDSQPAFQAARPVVEAARVRASAAWDAARAAATAAGAAAAWDAWDVAWSTWDAWDATWSTWDATWATAWAFRAAGEAAWAAWAAARAAAGDALKPAVDQLQDSAISLFRDMVSPAQAGEGNR